MQFLFRTSLLLLSLLVVSTNSFATKFLPLIKHDSKYFLVVPLTRVTNPNPALSVSGDGEFNDEQIITDGWKPQTMCCNTLQGQTNLVQIQLVKQVIFSNESAHFAFCNENIEEVSVDLFNMHKIYIMINITDNLPNPTQPQHLSFSKNPQVAFLNNNRTTITDAAQWLAETQPNSPLASLSSIRFAPPGKLKNQPETDISCDKVYRTYGLGLLPAPQPVNSLSPNRINRFSLASIPPVFKRKKMPTMPKINIALPEEPPSCLCCMTQLSELKPNTKIFPPCKVCGKFFICHNTPKETRDSFRCGCGEALKNTITLERPLRAEILQQHYKFDKVGTEKGCEKPKKQPELVINEEQGMVNEYLEICLGNLNFAACNLEIALEAMQNERLQFEKIEQLKVQHNHLNAILMDLYQFIQEQNIVANEGISAAIAHAEGIIAASASYIQTLDAALMLTLPLQPDGNIQELEQETEDDESIDYQSDT